MSFQRQYTLFNAGIRLGHAVNGWELAFIGRNLTNKYYRILQIDQPLGGTNQFGVIGAAS